MTRRERLERKADQRREWAAKREARSTADYATAKAATEHIPFGQPILVGHHSEGRHRAALKRSDNAMRRSCESAAMAKHHEQKALGIQAQLAESIFSDDSDAIEALAAKIDEAQKIQDLMTAANKIIRSKPKNESSPAKITALAAIGISATRAAELFTPDFCGRIGFASYQLSNNNANIRRMAGRIEEIKRLNIKQTMAEESTEGFTITGGRYVSITFAEKPDRDILTALKDAGFSWGAGSWSGKREDIPDSLREQWTSFELPRRGSLKWWAMERGIKIFIRCGIVYAWEGGEGRIYAYRTDVDNGRWMEHEDYKTSPWAIYRLTDEQRENFEQAAKDCYCYKGVERCDFCTTMRTPDGVLSSSDPSWDISAK